MRFLVVGSSFRTASLALRERLAFPAGELAGALRALRAQAGVDEGMIVSTCNRVELYVVSGKPHHCARDLRQLIARLRGVDPAELEGVIYEHVDREAVRHIFSVTSSLDAMVVGEAQIAGQVKEAYTAAARARAVGPLLSRCLHRAFAVAKRVRNETEIARHPVSISSVAADLAGRVFGDLAGATVLVVGAGEMAELAVRHLISDGAVDVRVANRTYERAVQLAFELGARPARFEDLRGQLLLADIVLTSTGSSTPIIGRRLVSEVMRERRQRPLFLVDIAVPRDVEREAGELPNVYLFDIDDLEQVVTQNLKERRREARQAERIVEEEVARFEEWVRTQGAVPLIKRLRERFHGVALAEAARTAQLLHLEDARQREALEAMASAIVNKLLHDPTMELKRQAQEADLAEATRQLFHLAGEGDGAGIDAGAGNDAAGSDAEARRIEEEIVAAAAELEGATERPAPDATGAERDDK
jgi:glutamyl-tRNA reductase